jgi:hypothetical protein
MGSSVPAAQVVGEPVKLRWMPPSLLSRTNVQSLHSLSDGESDSDDPNDNRTTEKWRSAISIPLCAVVPSLYGNGGFYEERNSYLDTKSYPYHPSQVGFVMHVYVKLISLYFSFISSLDQWLQILILNLEALHHRTML